MNSLYSLDYMFPMYSKFAYALFDFLTQEFNRSSICLSPSTCSTHNILPFSSTRIHVSHQSLARYNSCGTGNHGAQPDKTLKHRTPFTEYVPQIMPIWETGILTFRDRGSFVLSELNKTCSWCNSLNTTFKTCQWARQKASYPCCTSFPTSY